jgi:hypothetical protein
MVREPAWIKGREKDKGERSEEGEGSRILVWVGRGREERWETGEGGMRVKGQKGSEGE